MAKRRKTFRDRDFIMSPDGMFFCVIGNVHPPDRVISYLKYVPREEGFDSKWRKEGVAYGRILPHYSASGVLQTMEHLRRVQSRYLYLDPNLNIEMIAVPLSDVGFHFLPEERIREISSSSSRDPLEEKIFELASVISRECDLNAGALGVTGSVLLGIHSQRHSDIDLTVYGRESSRRTREGVKRLLDSESEGFERPKGSVLNSWVKEITKIHPLSPDVAKKLYRKKWNRGLFGNRPFSVHPIKTEADLTQRYGESRFEPLGLVTITCEVEDSADSMFLPCVYSIKNVRVLEGPDLAGISELVSYEGFYCDVASVKDEILARGKAERVVSTLDGSHHLRVLVGSFEAEGQDFIALKRWLES